MPARSTPADRLRIGYALQSVTAASLAAMDKPAVLALVQKYAPAADWAVTYRVMKLLGLTHAGSHARPNAPPDDLAVITARLAAAEVKLAELEDRVAKMDTVVQFLTAQMNRVA